MAPFNPDVKDTQDPNYLGYSKGIEQPKPNMTLAETFKGIGEIVKGSVSAADTVIKENIENTLRDQMQPQQEGYVSSLQNMLGGIKSGKYDIINADDSGRTMPQEVQAFGDRLDSLQESYTGGKFKPLEYRANLYKILKEVRANNPGYVDYVDKKASEITGFNIANAYMSSMLSTLNETATAGQQEYNKTIALIKENLGIVGEQMVTDFEQGKISRTDVLRKIASRKQEYEKMHYAKTIFEDKTREKGEKILLANETVDTRVPQIVNNAFEDVMTNAGYNGKSITDMISNHMDGTKPLDPTTVVALGQRFAALRPMLYKKAYDEFVTTGQVAVLGSKTVNEKINEGLAGFDQMSKLISKEQYTAAGYAADYSKAITDKDGLNVLLHPTMGAMVREYKALESIIGPNLYTKFIEERIKADPSLPNKIKNFHLDVTTGAIVQPRFETEGKPNTMKEDLEKPAKAGIKKDGPGAALEGRTINGVVKTLDVVTDKAMPEAARMNVAKQWAFDPSNFGVLDKFDMESLNPKTGRMKPGALSVWDKATNKEFATSVFTMAKKDSDLAARYMDWVQDGFGNSLFRRNINDLKDIQLEPGMRLTWDDKNLKLKLDTTGTVGPYVFKSNPGPRLGMPEGYKETPNVGLTQLKNAEFTIENLNRGLAGLKNVMDARGITDTKAANAYVLSLLTNAGFDPSKNVNGIPEAFMRAIITTGNPPEAPKASPAAAKPAPDNQPGGIPFQQADDIRSLQDWLKQPVKPSQLVLDRATGKYVPYEPNPLIKDKNQDRVKVNYGGQR